MKKLVYTILSIILLNSTINSQNQPEFDFKWPISEELILVNSGGNYGFDEGIYGGKWGFTDSLGKIIIPIKYDNANSFKNGIAIVSLNHKYGCINKSGKTVIPFKYDMLWEFNEGLAPANIGLKFTTSGGHDVVEKNGKWGFINQKGKIIIPFIYDSILRSFENGKAEVMLNDKVFFINKTGKEIKS